MKEKEREKGCGCPLWMQNSKWTQGSSLCSAVRVAPMGWCWKAQPSDEPPLGLSPHDDSWGCQLFLCLFLGQCNPGRGVWSHRSQDTDGTRGVEPPTSRFCPWSVASVQWFAAISWVPAAPVSPNWPCWSWGSAGTNPGATTHPKSGAQLWLKS